jgi:serine/threonine-protein kinase
LGAVRGQRVGPYELLEQIGSGGMGVVWRARDTVLLRDVAVKMLKRSSSPEDSERDARFFVEARAAASIRSRHVAQVLQLGMSEDGESFIAMELLEGKTLALVLARERRLQFRRAVRIARHVAMGMAAAHERGVIHRDLKPANIMLVTADGEAEVAKILDFGVAKRLSSDDAITGRGEVYGTLHFMAPEQLAGERTDHRCDIYTLGAVLYRMLVGEAPFEGDTAPALIRRVLDEAPRPLTDRLARVPPMLDAVVLRCLAKRPSDRFESMAELESALSVCIDAIPPQGNTGPFHHIREEDEQPASALAPTGAVQAGAMPAPGFAAETVPPTVATPPAGLPSVEPASARAMTDAHDTEVLALRKRQARARRTLLAAASLAIVGACTTAVFAMRDPSVVEPTEAARARETTTRATATDANTATTNANGANAPTTPREATMPASANTATTMTATDPNTTTTTPTTTANATTPPTAPRETTSRATATDANTATTNATTPADASGAAPSARTSKRGRARASEPVEPTTAVPTVAPPADASADAGVQTRDGFIRVRSGPP